MFRDTAPQHWTPDAARYELAQDDEQYWQDCVAQVGGQCFDLADEIARLTDKRGCDWRAADKPLLDQMHKLLTEAKALAERLT